MSLERLTLTVPAVPKAMPTGTKPQVETVSDSGDNIKTVSRETLRGTHKRKRTEDSSSSSSDSSSEEEEVNMDFAKEGRNSAKAFFLAKTLGPVADYGGEYELLQYIYDLWLWSSLGAKKSTVQQTTGGEASTGKGKRAPCSKRPASAMPTCS